MICTRCGHAVGDDGNVNLELGYAYCASCEADHWAFMREMFPHGQCQTCGGVYHPVVVRCDTCHGLGEVLVKPHVVANPQWGDCSNCLGAGKVTVLRAMHEETLCGFPDGDDDWSDEVVTHATVLRWARTHQEADIDAVARKVWLENLASWSAGARADLDIPF